MTLPEFDDTERVLQHLAELQAADYRMSSNAAVMRRWLVMEIGCLECHEDSHVIGLYDTEQEARQAAEPHQDDGYYPDRAQVFDLLAPQRSDHDQHDESGRP